MSRRTQSQRTMAGRAPARFSTERIEHKSAADGRIKASPVPLNQRNFANMRGIFYLSAENAKTVDWLVEQGGLEPPVSREVWLKENRRKCSRFFASKSAKHRPENEFA